MLRSTKGASKARRDQINAEIRALRDLLPLPDGDRPRLSYLHVMALACIYTRKGACLRPGEFWGYGWGDWGGGGTGEAAGGVEGAEGSAPWTASGRCAGFSTVDSEREGRGVQHHGQGTGEALRVQHHGQRAGGARGFSTGDSGQGDGGCAVLSTMDSGQRTGKALRVQHHGQRAGNGSCADFSTVDSGQGTGEVLRVQHRGQRSGDRRGAEGSASWIAVRGREAYGIQHHGRGMGSVRGSASCTVVREDGRSTGFSTRDSERGMGMGAVRGSVP